MLQCRLLLGCLLFVVLVWDFVNGGCQLTLPLTSNNKPSYRWQFGRRFLQVPTSKTLLNLSHGDHVIGECTTGFKPFRYQNFSNFNPMYYYYDDNRHETATNQYTVSLKCNETTNDIRLNFNNDYRYTLSDTVLSCNDLKWGLYETSSSRCESPKTGSYLIATKNLESQNVLAHACYDLDSMTLHRLDYIISSDTVLKDAVEQSTDLNGQVLPKHNLTLSPYDVEVEHFDMMFNRLNETLTTDHTDESSHVNWLKLANYQYHSIAMDGAHKSYLRTFGTLTDIIWWPNLLYGNWRKYTAALQKHLDQTGYRVYAGVASSVTLTEKRTKCTHVVEEELMLAATKRSIPRYVWNYLKPFDNSGEIVIIGYNSPFFEFPNERNAIFCEDLCDRVSWLQNVTSTFRYSTMGVIFCCTPEAVRESGKFVEFPREEPTETLPQADIAENIIEDSGVNETTATAFVDPDSDDVNDELF